MHFIRKPPDGIGSTEDIVGLQHRGEGPGTWSPIFPTTLQVLLQTSDMLYMRLCLKSVVNQYLDSLRNPSLKPFRFHLQDLCIVQIYALIRLVTVYIFRDGVVVSQHCHYH